MADDGKIGTLLHKLYLMPGKTGHRYGEHIFTPSRREQKRPVKVGCGWKYSPRIPPRAVLRTPGMKHIRDTIFHSASQQSTLHILAKPI